MNLLNILFHDGLDWDRFDSLILGSLSLEDYIAAFFFSAIGQFVAIRLHASWRDKNSDRTPKKWSTKFFILDNIRRFAAGMALMFIIFRFFGEITGKEFGMFYTFLIGLGFAFGLDVVILRNLKNRTSFLDAKTSDKPDNKPE